MRGVFSCHVDHAFREVNTQHAAGTLIGERDREVPWASSHVDNTFALDGLAAGDRFFKSQSHARTQDFVNQAIRERIAVSIDRVKPLGIRIEKLGNIRGVGHDREISGTKKKGNKPYNLLKI
jgi:hypothetical protein